VLGEPSLERVEVGVPLNGRPFRSRHGPARGDPGMADGEGPFYLPPRQVTGFGASLLKTLRLDWPGPGCSTLCRCLAFDRQTA
jgi:hypothetical protein